MTGIDNRLRSLIRVGYVSSQETNDRQAAARVVYADRQNLVSEPLPILQKSSKGTQDYWSPEVGEQVLTVHLPNGSNRGFILGSFQSTSAPPPVTDPNKRHTTFADGSVFEFDKNSSTLFINTKGPISIITSGKVFVQAGKIELVGELEITGNIKITGDIEHEGNMNTTGIHIDSNGPHG